MRKIVFIIFLGLTFILQGQNYPPQGNWNAYIGSGVGLFYLGNHPRLDQRIEKTSINTFLGVEKHFSRTFSLNFEYGLFAPIGTNANSNNISIIPTLKRISNNRFIFSMGIRFATGINHYDGESDPMLGLGHQFRFRWLLGKSREYHKIYKGEINLIFEPFYHIKRGGGYVGSNRQVRLQYVIPLSK